MVQFEQLIEQRFWIFKVFVALSENQSIIQRCTTNCAYL